MPAYKDSLSRILKIASAPDPGAQAMASAAQTAGSMPGVTPAPAMAPPPEEKPQVDPAALSKMQNEVNKRDKEIADLRAKVQDAKNQAAIVEMKQQMAEEQAKMRDSMRKEYTQMQEKLRAQQKELDNRQSLFKQEEAQHKAVMTANEAQHKSRLAEIANSHQAELQQQVADQQIALAKNEAKSLKEIADQQSQSRLQQADEYVAMTDKARKDADRLMQEKEKKFISEHPAFSPIVQSRINDATSAIARLSKGNRNMMDPFAKVAAPQTPQPMQQQQPLPQQPQPQQPQPQQQPRPKSVGEQMTSIFESKAYKPSQNAYRFDPNQYKSWQKTKELGRYYDAQFGSASDSASEAEMGIARMENAATKAEAEGNKETARHLREYIDYRKRINAGQLQRAQRGADRGITRDKIDVAQHKVQNDGDNHRQGFWDQINIFGKGESDISKARNRYVQDKEDEASRGTWYNNAVTRAIVSPFKGIRDDVRNWRKRNTVQNAYGVEGTWFNTANHEDSDMNDAYQQEMDNRGLSHSFSGNLKDLVLHGAEAYWDIASYAALASGVGSAAGAGMIAAKQGLKAALKAGGKALAKNYAKQFGIKSMARGFGSKELINRHITMDAAKKAIEAGKPVKDFVPGMGSRLWYRTKALGGGAFDAQYRGSMVKDLISNDHPTFTTNYTPGMYQSGAGAWDRGSGKFYDASGASYSSGDLADSPEFLQTANYYR